jgi:hypothetical protein
VTLLASSSCSLNVLTVSQRIDLILIQRLSPQTHASQSLEFDLTVVLQLTGLKYLYLQVTAQIKIARRGAAGLNCLQLTLTVNSHKVAGKERL